MQTKGSFTQELIQTIRLAIPITAGLFGQVLISITATLFAGRISAIALAAVAASNILVNTLIVFGTGFLSSIPLVNAQAHGACRQDQKIAIFKASVWLAFGLGIMFAFLSLFLSRIIGGLGVPIPVLGAARRYLVLMGWSSVPTFGYLATKMYCDSLGKPVLPMWILYGTVLINFFLHWLLVFGNWGFPHLGLEGSAWAIIVARLLAMVGMGFYTMHLIDVKMASLRPFSLDVRVTKTLIRLGLPIGLQYLCEIIAVNFAAIMMSWVGTNALAAHQIAITCAGASYRFPLGISQAVSVRIGHVIGSGKSELVRTIGFGGIGVSTAIMTCYAFGFILFGTSIAESFTKDSSVIKLLVSLLLLVGFFQLADGIQVTAAGALRGLADVFAPTVFTYVSYWVIAIPVGYSLAFPIGLGPLGIWSGFAAGLFLVAIFNLVRFTILTNRSRFFQPIVPPASSE
jgi:multidrug resistance protein, MATE family